MSPRPTYSFWIGLALVAFCSPGRADPGSGALAALPAALYADPPADAQFPASSRAVQFRSHGARLNAQIYRPPGAGPHPAAVIFHGLPGNEQNLDLAQALRRAGWTVVTFHYTGSWGSGGRFTLRAGIADAHELLATLRDPTTATAWGIDPEHVLIVGHSYGGYVAARTAGEEPGVIGAVLLAPWDIAADARRLRAMATADRAKAAASAFDDIEGRLSGATPQSLAQEAVAHGEALDLPTLAAHLAALPLLVITATHDADSCKAVELATQLRRLGAARFTHETLDSDHAFNSQRIALLASILRWAATLPGAPHS